jgi:hypothetical protein
LSHTWEVPLQLLFQAFSTKKKTTKNGKKKWKMEKKRRASVRARKKLGRGVGGEPPRYDSSGSLWKGSVQALKKTSKQVHFHIKTKITGPSPIFFSLLSTV